MAEKFLDKALREMLIESGAFNVQKFFNQIRANEISKIEKKLEHKDIQAIGGANIWDEAGQYPVHIAAAEGHINMLRMLIECNADIDQPTQEEHKTALHYAVHNKHHDTVTFLIDVGARADLQDVYRRTARSYAVEEDHMRVVFEGEQVNERLKRLSEVFQRLMKMSNINIRKPRPEEAKRICHCYEAFAKEIDNANEEQNLTLPLPATVGPSVVHEMLNAMKKRRHGNDGFLCSVPREEFTSNNSKPFTSFIKWSYCKYFKNEPAVRIDDIWVSKMNRGHFWGSMLLSAALTYILIGPHPPPKRIFKVFCVVCEQNHAAVKFFRKAGFLPQPPHNIPPRMRQLGYIVYAVNHAGHLLGKVYEMLKPGLRFDADWVTSEQLREQEEKAMKEAEARDMKVFNKRLDAIFAEKDVPRMTKLQDNHAGDVVIPLGLAQPHNPQREADRARVLHIVEKRKKARHAIENPKDAREKPKGPKYTCENDRVPADILRANEAAVMRMRDLHRWKHEIEGSKVGNSRILACPDILRDCWLDELEYDAFLSLPDDWVKRRDEDGNFVYFNKDTHQISKTRPTRKNTLETRSAAGEDEEVEARLEDDDFFDGESVEERMRLREEAEKKRVKDRRLWEREMDAEIDKALGHSESLESFIKRMNILYPKEKAEEIILKAGQALQAAKKVQGTNLKVESMLEKKSVLSGVTGMFKTPLQKAIDQRKAIEKSNAREMERRTKVQESDDPQAIDTGAESPSQGSGASSPVRRSVGSSPIRPSSATVSATSFGTPTRRRQAMLETEPSPTEGKISDKEVVGSPKKKAKAAPSETLSFKPKYGHTSDAAADWIQREADMEQAMHDADSMLEMFAPPPSSGSSASVPSPKVGDNLAAKNCLSNLSTVVESPVQSPSGYGGHFGQEEVLSSINHESMQTHIVPFSRRPCSKTNGDRTLRPLSGMSLASTVQRSRGPTASSTLHGLDGASRPSSQHSISQGVMGTGSECSSRPASTGSQVPGPSSRGQGFEPWSSQMFGLQSESHVPNSSEPTPESWHGHPAMGHFGVSHESVQSISASSRSIIGLDGPSSSTPSRPTTAEWMVPWRMGAGGRMPPKSSRGVSASSTSSARSLFSGFDGVSRPSSRTDSRPCSQERHATSYFGGLDGSTRPASSWSRHSYGHSRPITAESRQEEEHATGADLKESLLPSIAQPHRGDKNHSASLTRPQTAALKPKALQLKQRLDSRPHSAVITPGQDALPAYVIKG